MDGIFYFIFFNYIYILFSWGFFASTRHNCIYCYILYNVLIILDYYATT